jgi:hypothetical protein
VQQVLVGHGVLLGCSGGSGSADLEQT